MQISPRVKRMNIILSVDDEPGILALRRRILELSGYEVLNARDGLEALRIFDSHSVDLVLLDYFMPEMDGGAVASEMKRRQPDVPVIIVSASLDCVDLVRDNVDSFICKGNGPELLLAEIRKFLSKKVPDAQAQLSESA
jgi:CheY-like chemotaxis protein